MYYTFFFCYRQLRKLQPNQILMCLCGTLICLYATFFVMNFVDRRRGEIELVSRIPCTIIAGLLHFSTLSSILWMGVEGANMLLMIILVMNSYVSGFMVKAAAIAWGKYE